MLASQLHTVLCESVVFTPVEKILVKCILVGPIYSYRLFIYM